MGRWKFWKTPAFFAYLVAVAAGCSVLGVLIGIYDAFRLGYSVLARAAQLTFDFGYSAAFQSGQITGFGLLTIYGEFLVISICALAAWLEVGAMLKTGPAQPPL
jgi:Ni/Fe-hydrogenase subunit HybB-like protein